MHNHFLLYVRGASTTTTFEKYFKPLFEQVDLIDYEEALSYTKTYHVIILDIDHNLKDALHALTVLQTKNPQLFCIAIASRFDAASIATLLDHQVQKMLAIPLDLEKILHVLLEMPKHHPVPTIVLPNELSVLETKLHTLIYEIQMEGDFTDSHKEALLVAFDRYATLLYTMPLFVPMAKELNKLDQSIENGTDIFNRKIQKTTIILEELVQSMGAWHASPLERNTQELMMKNCKKIIATLR